MTLTAIAPTTSQGNPSHSALHNLLRSQIYNVMDVAFGAAGDGVTDDAAAIQAAITAAEAFGGTVFLPAATFLIGTGLTLTSNVTLEGTGKGSALKVKDSSDIEAITVSGTGNVLRNFQLNGNKANQTGGGAGADGIVFTEAANENLVENVYFLNVYGETVQLFKAHRNIIRKNTFKTCGGSSSYATVMLNSGVTSGSLQVTGNQICDNEFLGSIGIGISLIDGCEFNRISGNYMQGSGGSGANGIQLDRTSKRNIVSLNVIEGCQDGIDVLNVSTYNTIVGNVCRGGTADGIAMVASHYNVISGNVCELNGGRGIYLCTTSNDYNTISGNACWNNNQFNSGANNAGGIEIASGSNNLIASNNCSDNLGGSALQKYGIRIAASQSNNQVINNWASGNVTGDISDAGTSTVLAHNHGGAADDHSGYAYLAGRSGGQTLIGGTASGNSLTLKSTSHATKGKVILGNAGTTAYDEVNERLGVGTASPSATIHAKTSGTDALLIESSGANVYMKAKDNSGTTAEIFNTDIGGGSIYIGGAAAVNWVIRNNSYTIRFFITPSGNVVVGNASSALATNATDGFLYIPTCAGAPSGTPTSVAGTKPLVYDTTNNKLYIYNGAWKGVTLA